MFKEPQKEKLKLKAVCDIAAKRLLRKRQGATSRATCGGKPLSCVHPTLPKAGGNDKNDKDTARQRNSAQKLHSSDATGTIGLPAARRQTPTLAREV